MIAPSPRMYLLDTNICIYAINNKYPHLHGLLASIPASHIFLSAVTVVELVYGAAKSHWGERTKRIMDAFRANYPVLPFTEEDALLLGVIRAELDSRGTPIGAYDGMIATQGVARKLTVVTHNTKEFSRVPGIMLEDWIEFPH